MSKRKKKSVPVNMPKADKNRIGTISGLDVMLHSAGKPWRSGSSIAHNNKCTNPKNIRRDGKLAIKKEGW